MRRIASSVSFDLLCFNKEINLDIVLKYICTCVMMTQNGISVLNHSAQTNG